MTISDKIFAILKEKGITQKQFSKDTKIPESTISDWKRKKTNPSSDSILVICKTLDISPENLLSGTTKTSSPNKTTDYMLVSQNSKEGVLIENYQNLNDTDKKRLEEYLMKLMKG